MFQLQDVVLQYDRPEGDILTVLDHINLHIAPGERWAVIGPSGCGKTTLLNIIGGLDRYTSGEMAVAGVPTSAFRDRDWDTYRNHSIGFVFQSYNLIPHQTVLRNVELALTLSGVSRAERRRRAADGRRRFDVRPIALIDGITVPSVW